MNNREQDARQAIINAAKELLNEANEVDKITVRQIAERANVGIGLINYHFMSKDNLLSIAIGDVMARTITNFINTDAYANLKPVDKLKTLLKQLCNLIGHQEKLMQFTLSHDITEGNMQTPLHLVPVLREIFGRQKDDMQLRIIAMQILYPIQFTGLNPSAFQLYSGIDLSIDEQRNLFIDILIDNLTIQNNKEVSK